MYVYNCIFDANFTKKKIVEIAGTFWFQTYFIRFCRNLSGRKSRHFEAISNTKKFVWGRNSTFLMSGLLSPACFLFLSCSHKNQLQSIVSVTIMKCSLQGHQTFPPCTQTTTLLFFVDTLVPQS